MGHIDVQRVSYSLPDGRPLLDDVSFRVGEGAVAALVGANGAGKSTLLRFIAGTDSPQEGAITVSGGLAVMPQFIGQMQQGNVRDLLLSVAPAHVRDAAYAIDAVELELMEKDDAETQMRYAQCLSDWADVHGYDVEIEWDLVCMAAMGKPFAEVKWRQVATLSGGEQKRIVLEALLRGRDEVLLLDEPDNYLDVPGKRWLEARLRQTKKTVLLVSHDRELLAQVATHIVSVELGAAGNTVWVHGGGFATFHEARDERFARLEELRLRWDEKHAQLRELVQTLKVKAAYNDGMSARYRAACTRLAKFEEAGPPQAVPLRQHLKMRLTGGRTGKRAVVCEGLALSNLTEAFDLELWFGERLAVLGGNGTGKSHFLRLLALGGSDPDVEHRPVDDVEIAPVAHTGVARLGARVRPGWFAQTHVRPDLKGRTLLEILHRGDAHRSGLAREGAARALDRYELAYAGEQLFDTLSGGQQARFQILLLELSGATLLLLDEPTDNLDIASADALEAGLEAFTGTVIAVTHDRWFARGFDRFLLVGSDGGVRETDGPVWEGRG